MVKTIPFSESKSISEKDLEEAKLSSNVYREAGVNPVIISVVLPTFNNGSEEYIETMQMVIRKLSKLIDRGAIDEIVIVDGSRDSKGMPDFEFMRYLLALCVNECTTFKREVDFVRSMPEGKQKSMEGRFDFSIRFLSQLDPLLHKIFLNHKLLTEDEIETLKKGKGAGLWYSIPVTYGNIICFVDSDIKSFRKFYVEALCKPILDGWHANSTTYKCNPDIVFTKATYVRKNVKKDGFHFGGRLARIGMIPLFRALKKMNEFSGLDEIGYPVSGECAFSIDALKEIQFSNGYDIETSVLCQLHENFGMDKIAQVDLGVYQHIPGDDDHVKAMMEEASSALKFWAQKYKKDIDIDTLCELYSKEAKDIIPEFVKKASEYKDFVYTKEDAKVDEERAIEFTGILKAAWNRDSEPKLLHAWRDIAKKTNLENGYSYQNLKLSLRQRINKFTSGVIFSSIYVDRSKQIIEDYAEAHGP